MLNLRLLEILKYLVFVFIMLFNATCLFAQIRVGDKAPEIEISYQVNNKANDVIQAGGKMTFLEFWATWCGPCVASIPHVNKLETLFNREINFVSITDEDTAKVNKFLQKRKMNSTVVIDNVYKTHDNFKIREIPNGFLIAADGNILWQGHPADLKEDALRYILDQYKPSIKNNAAFSIKKNSSPSYLSINIEQSVLAEEQNLLMTDNVFKGTNYPLKDLLFNLIGLSPARTIFEAENIKLSFSYAARNELNSASNKYFFGHLLLNYFNIKIDSVNESKKVFELKISDKRKFDILYNSDNVEPGVEEMLTETRWMGKNKNISDLINILEKKYPLPILNTLGNKENNLNFNVQLFGSIEETLQDIENKYGIKFYEKIAKIKMIELKD